MTMHRIQMVCRGRKKNTWKDDKCCGAGCVCVFGICLKCPCVSSSLEGSRSCVGSRPVSSLCSCCSVMLLALSTQTHGSMLTAGTSLLDLHVLYTALKKKKMFVFVSRHGFKQSSSQIWGKQVDSAFKINTAVTQHSKSDSAC